HRLYRGSSRQLPGHGDSRQTQDGNLKLGPEGDRKHGKRIDHTEGVEYHPGSQPVIAAGGGNVVLELLKCGGRRRVAAGRFGVGGGGGQGEVVDGGWWG